MVNSGLQAQYDWAANTLEDFGKPQNITLKKFANQGFYNAVFGAPRIMVAYAPSDPKSVIYRSTIESGELRVCATDDDDDDTMTSFKLENMRLAFPVNMKLDGLPEDGDQYKKIREKMNRPGNYSIQQLLVDFQSGCRKTNVLDAFTVWLIFS
jgi:hypothetical protein